MIALLVPFALAAEPAPAEEPEVVPGWKLVLPFGLPQFSQGQPRAGTLYAGLQVAGLAATAWSTVQMREYARAGQIDQELTWRMVSAGTVALASGAWFASLVHGSVERERQLEELEASIPTWTPPVAEAAW